MSPATIAATNQTRLRPIALPSEHGGWGFLLEPILLGLLSAPSLAGLFIAIATIGVFLTRHPLKIAWSDRARGRHYARTRLAQLFVILYIGIAIAGVLFAIALTDVMILSPAVIAIPLAIIQLSFDLRHQSRSLVPELTGPAALATSGAVIAVAGGWEVLPALGLWLVLAARSLPSVLYVRARIRLAKDKPALLALPILAHVAGLAVVTGLAMLDLAPWLTIAVMLILLGRAIDGFMPRRRTMPAKTIGFQELAYGLLMVIVTALGLHVGF